MFVCLIWGSYFFHRSSLRSSKALVYCRRVVFLRNDCWHQEEPSEFLKVRKFRKQFMVSSILPKNKTNSFCFFICFLEELLSRYCDLYNHPSFANNSKKTKQLAKLLLIMFYVGFRFCLQNCFSLRCSLAPRGTFRTTVAHFGNSCPKIFGDKSEFYVLTRKISERIEAICYVDLKNLTITSTK